MVVIDSLDDVRLCRSAAVRFSAVKGSKLQSIAFDAAGD